MQWCQATDTVEVTSIPSGVTHTTKKGRGPVSDSLRLLTPGKASGCSKIQQQLCILSIRVTFHLFSVLNFWHYHHHHHRFTAIIQVNLHLQLAGQQHLHTLADGNQCIRIREKTLEFSLTLLSTLSPYLNASYITHTHTPVGTALFPGLPRWAGTRKVKPIWILLKQETVAVASAGPYASLHLASDR